MKFVVDKFPKTPEECEFAEFLTDTLKNGYKLDKPIYACKLVPPPYNDMNCGMCRVHIDPHYCYHLTEPNIPPHHVPGTVEDYECHGNPPMWVVNEVYHRGH